MADSSQAVLGGDTGTLGGAQGTPAPKKVSQGGVQGVPKVPDDPALDAMGAKIDAAVNAPLPDHPTATALPKLPNQPVIDQKEWQNLGLGLVAMAMMAGGTKGNWMHAASFLTGAINGYQEGNAEKAKDDFQKYQVAYQHAEDEERQKNQAYQDILKNRQLSVNEMMAQYKVLSAQDGRQLQYAAAEQRNMTEMMKAADYHNLTLAHINKLNADAHGSLDPGLTNDTKALGDALAWSYFINGKVPPMGLGAKSPAREAMMRSYSELPKALRMSPQEFAVTQGTNAARIKSLGYLTQKQEALAQASSTAGKNLDMAVSLADKVSSSDINTINGYLRRGEVMSGNTAAAQLNVALDTAAREYARAASGSTGAGGVNQGDYLIQRENLSMALTQRQLAGVATTMKKDLSNVGQGYTETLKAIQSGMTSEGTPQQHDFEEPTDAPPAGPEATINFSDYQD